MEYTSTLLIVESPELKRRIDALGIPYLTTLATHGFLWWPKLNADKTRLLRRANKELIDHRRAIKREAAHAVNIICATDPDPAGAFIAWSCRDFLKREVAFHPLSSLNRSSLWSLVRRTDRDESNTENLQHLLFWLTWLQQQARPIIQYLPHGLRHLSSLLLADILRNPDAYALSVHAQQPDTTAQHLLGINYQNLPRLLAQQYLQGWPMSETYQSLWKLYLNKEALITYPRTSGLGFYASTWQEQAPFFDGHNLCMTPLRSVLADSHAHESIRVTNLSVTPADTRKWLPRLQRELYRSIWTSTRSILYPSEQELSYLFKCKEKSFSDSIEIGKLCKIIDHHYLLRHSNLHATLSAAISNNWIRFEEREQRICVIPDHSLPSITTSLQQGFKQIRACLNQPINQTNKINETKTVLREVLADMNNAISGKL